MGSNHTITCAGGGRGDPCTQWQERKDVKCRNGISRTLIGRKRSDGFSANRGSLLFGYPSRVSNDTPGKGLPPFQLPFPQGKGAAPSFLATLPSREGAGG